MNSSAYYLGEVLELLVSRALDKQEDLKEKPFGISKWDVEGPGLDEGILEGYCIVIGKLFQCAASIGIFKALPEGLQETITPETLVEDLKKGDTKRMLQLRKAFRDTHDSVTYSDIDLKSLLEEIIDEAQALKGNLTSYFDEGKLMGYSFSFDVLYVQIEFFIPELLRKLPRKLRDIEDPEFLDQDAPYKKRGEVYEKS